MARATRRQAAVAASCLFTKNLFPSFSSTADTTLEFWRWSSAPCVRRYSLGAWGGPSQLTPRFPDQWIKWVSSTCLEAQKSQSSHNPLLPAAPQQEDCLCVLTVVSPASDPTDSESETRLSALRSAVQIKLFFCPMLMCSRSNGRLRRCFVVLPCHPVLFLLRLQLLPAYCVYPADTDNIHVKRNWDQLIFIYWNIFFLFLADRRRDKKFVSSSEAAVIFEPLQESAPDWPMADMHFPTMQWGRGASSSSPHRRFMVMALQSFQVAARQLLSEASTS